jgi:hypothetical protein
MIARILPVAWVLFLVCLPSAAQAGDPPPGPPFNLADVRHIDEFTGSDAARQMLARQGFVVTDQQFRQIFEAYVGSDLPKFITVDSVWHTYHVLLEEGVRQLEVERARLLRRFSTQLYQTAIAHQNETASVYRDLALFAAVGTALQDPAAVARLPADQRRAVADVLASIQAPAGPMPGALFFGLPLMPELFRPTSFYAKTEELRRYFAARQWYATQAFRLASDAETLRAIHLAQLIESNSELKSIYRGLTNPYDALVGPTDDPGVDQYSEILTRLAAKRPFGPPVLESFRTAAERLPDAQINDQGLSPADYARRVAQTKGMRVLGSRRLPSAVLFQRTVDPEVPGRRFPSGLDVFAAGPLACDAGRRALSQAIPNPAMREAVLRADGGRLPDSLHGQAMELLTLLQQPVPPTAPAVFRTPAWHDKQLATSLAAWAEERHTWALHAKVLMSCFGGSKELPGYVSPYPEFYRRLGQLARQAAALLAKAAAEPDLAAAGREWLALMEAEGKRLHEQGLPPLEEEAIDRYTRQMQAIAECRKENERPDSSIALGDVRAKAAITESARRCVQNRGVTEFDRRRMAAFLRPLTGQAVDLLPEFAGLCDRLAAIAQKQLDGKPRDHHDLRLIRDYGATLGRFHFYDGNSYLMPRDDFPLVAPVFVSPRGNQAEILYTGVGRPETIYVIVPSGKRLVMHRGAVLTYREFRRPIGAPLGDAQWVTEVRAGVAPPSLPFTAAFRQGVNEEDVAARIRAGQPPPGVDQIPGREITRAMIDVLGDPGQEKPKDVYERLHRRVIDADVPALLDAIPRVPPRLAPGIWRCVSELNWKPHAGRLLQWLEQGANSEADAAAYVLAGRPADIDVDRLALRYNKQSPRTRRLFCYLIGKSKHPGPRGTQVLLAAMADPHPALRYQGALAVADAGVQNAEIIARLMTVLDDQNPFVAAAAAHALAALQAKEAAPRMCRRLAQAISAPPLSPQEEDDFRAPLVEGTDYGSPPYLQVLNGLNRGAWHPAGIGTLFEELVHGLGDLRFTPACEELRKLLRHSVDPSQRPASLAAEALDTLLKLEPENERNILLEVLGRRQSSKELIEHASRRIDESGNAAYIEPLLPWLDELDRGDLVANNVAGTVAGLLKEVNRSDPKGARLWDKVRCLVRKQLRDPSRAGAVRILFPLYSDLAEELLSLALDKNAETELRVHALDLLWQAPHQRFAQRLLPLLEESTHDVRASDSLCESAIATIGTLCADPESRTADPTAVQAVRRALEKMLRGHHGKAALEALLEMERQAAHADWREMRTEDRQRVETFLLHTASNRSLAYATRVRALEEITNSDDPGFVKQLLPLLDDTTFEGGDDLSVGECAANTLATLLGEQERIKVDTPRPRRAELIRKQRTRVEQETEP